MTTGMRISTSSSTTSCSPRRETSSLSTSSIFRSMPKGLHASSTRSTSSAYRRARPSTALLAETTATIGGYGSSLELALDTFCHHQFAVWRCCEHATTSSGTYPSNSCAGPLSSRGVGRLECFVGADDRHLGSRALALELGHETLGDKTLLEPPASVAVWCLQASVIMGCCEGMVPGSRSGSEIISMPLDCPQRMVDKNQVSNLPLTPNRSAKTCGPTQRCWRPPKPHSQCAPVGNASALNEGLTQRPAPQQVQTDPSARGT